MIRSQQPRSRRMPPRAVTSLEDPLSRKDPQRACQRSRMCSGVPRQFLRASRRFPQGIRDTEFCHRMKTPRQSVTHRNPQQVVGRIIHGGGSITAFGFFRTQLRYHVNGFEPQECTVILVGQQIAMNSAKILGVITSSDYFRDSQGSRTSRKPRLLRRSAVELLPAELTLERLRAYVPVR